MTLINFGINFKKPEANALMGRTPLNSARTTMN